MADEKITALPVATATVLTDVYPMVADVPTVPITKQITFEDLLASISPLVTPNWNNILNKPIENIFFEDVASDIGGYFQLEFAPTGGVEDLDSAAATAGETLIEAYATPVLGLTQINAAIWEFNIYRYVSATAGLTELLFRFYNRTTPGGAETLLFEVSTGEINDTAVTFQTFQSTQPDFPIAITDRLVIKTYAKTDSGSAKTVFYYHDGTTRNSHIHSNALIGILANVNGDGWFNPGQSWTYASATSFVVAGDQTAIFTPGLKLKMTNTTVKYFYVASSSYGAPNTTVNLVANSDYSLANVAITANYYSRIERPLGFPEWMTYAPALTGWSSPPTTTMYQFRITGKTCDVAIRQGTATAATGTSTIITGPIVAATVANGLWTNLGNGTDNSVNLTTAVLCTISSGSADIVCYKDPAGGAWTNGGNKRVSLSIRYPIP